MSSGRVILKQTGLSRVVPIAVWVFCVLASGDAIVEGTLSFAVQTVAVMAAVALATWLLLFSPHLAVDADGVTIVNPLRVVRVPFGALIELKVGAVVSIVARVAEGRDRKITSWNAPGSARRRPARRVGGIGGSGAAGMMPNSAAGGDPRAWSQPRTEPAGSEVLLAFDRFRTPWEREHPGGDRTALATISLRWREWLALAALILLNVAIRLR